MKMSIAEIKKFENVFLSIGTLNVLLTKQQRKLFFKNKSSNDEFETQKIGDSIFLIIPE